MPPITPLSTGVLARIMAGEEVASPVLQILSSKKICGGESERYRMLISDGKYLNSYAMLATQLNYLHAEGKLNENTIIRVEKYITSLVNKSDAGKRVLIILDLTVVNSAAEVGRKIGDPVSYTEATPSSDAPVVVKQEPKPLATTSYNNNNSYNKPANNNGNANATMNQSLNFNLTHPIASLSPYQNKWVLKVRCTAKSPIRTWSNPKGEGKLFSIDLMDESGEIRATAFKEQCDKFYDVFEVDRVFYIAKAQLKPARKEFSSIKNEYELTFTGETVVQPCEDEDTGIPDVRYDFVPISKVAAMDPKASVDIIGICKEAGEVQTFTARTTNKEFKKRDLTLVDNSNAAITVTLWNDEAVNFEGHAQPVILVKNARINEFNGGKSLSAGNSSMVKINPDIPEGHKLRGWFDNGGGENITNVSARTGGGNISTSWMTFHEARIKNLGTGDRPDYFQTKAVVHVVKSQNAFYKACPTADCNKKVIDEGNGHFRCERCNSVFPNYKYRLLINMSIGDWTSNRWVTCFNEVGEQLLGRTANEIGSVSEQAAESGDSTELEEIFSAINFKSYIFKLRTKVEMFGDMNRNKISVQSAAPINYKEYNAYLIENIKKLTGIGKA